MYVEIGDYEVKQGEFLPSDNLNEHFVFEWDIDKGDYYTLIMVDHDAPYPENPVKSPFVHLLMVNVEKDVIKEENMIIPYLPPSPPNLSSKPHEYEILLFKQSMPIAEVYIQDRNNFDLEDWFRGNMSLCVDGEYCDFQLVDQMSFFSGHQIPNDFSQSPQIKSFQDDDQKFIDVFQERYDTDKLSEEDLVIIGETLGIQDVSQLKPKELQIRIGQIITYGD
jgi:hypothetical protein